MTSRRQFIRITFFGAGALAVGGGSIKAVTGFKSADANNMKVNLTRTPTYCEVCFWKCAGWVYKNENGEIWKIIGNDEDPNCNGRLCPRGTGGIGMYYDKDRLKQPLIRTGGKGIQSFKEVSWDEAFDYIATRMKSIGAKYGPESIALFNHGSGGKHFGNLLKAFGSSNITAPSYAQCKGPREEAFRLTFGSELSSPEPTDIRDTRCLVLIGSHIGENMHNGHVQEMSDAIDKGAAIITVDPRFSTAASKSKFWLPIKPATDIALLLSWMNVIIGEEWYDKKYVEKYCLGFEQLKLYVKSFTPEWAYPITNITPDIIRKTAKEMANASPAVLIHPGRHVTWYGDDTQRLRCVAILNAILGSYGRRGGFYFPSETTLPGTAHPPFPEPKWSWKALLNGRFAMAEASISDLFIEASLPENKSEKKIKGWFVVGTNLITTIPDSAKTIKAIQNLDLLVVSDTMPMEITGYADVVLPECTYLERYDDIRVGPHREPNIALRMPAAEPLYNTKPAAWMVQKLSEKLSLGAWFPYNNFEDVLDKQLKTLGTSLEEMQRTGVKKFPREADDLYLIEGQDFTFPTQSGKIELYSGELQAAGFDPLPRYTAHPEAPEGFYRLNYGRAPMHTFSRTSNNPNLSALMSENSVWINPKVAKTWGLANDQYIWLKNQDGVVSGFPIKVRITERIRWDSVYMVHGFGRADKKLSRAYGRGANDAELITNVMTDPLMGGTGMRGNFVTFLVENPKGEVKA
jgi:thiosulfate reductase / polysulfide reductase chain A